ncbi:hypothetical protein SBC1_40300 (plasmid) [Caballeronia sp. SBC1]|jgi:hypothetical protein|nr:hypothetical protein SBC2_47580 [Caballeronia sp. SBC2]QIN63990.1 hypothetical protein SBC1_40300 [Caballeronia sp. SBC1]
MKACGEWGLVGLVFVDAAEHWLATTAIGLSQRRPIDLLQSSECTELVRRCQGGERPGADDQILPIGIFERPLQREHMALTR